MSGVRVRTLTAIGTVLSYSMPGTAVEDEAFAVTGQLYKEGSGEAIPSARIDFIIDGELITYDLTDASGQYAFSIVITTPGDYDIIISYAGGACTSGCIESCVVDCIYACTVGCVSGCISGCVEGCIGGCTYTCIAGCTYACIEDCTLSCISGCTQGCTHSCTASCTVGCVSGCTAGCTASCIQSCVAGCVSSQT